MLSVTRATPELRHSYRTAAVGKRAAGEITARTGGGNGRHDRLRYAAGVVPARDPRDDQPTAPVRGAGPRPGDDASDPSITQLTTTGGGDVSVASTTSAPGATFGRFVVVGSLGAGGMGVVLAAFDPELDRKVALKLLHPGTSAAVEARARLQREAQAMARLAHPNALTVYEVGRAGDQLFIAMELVDGTTLRAWLGERRRPWREVLAMFVAAGRGLEAAHAAGLVHRDFKPENVLIGRDGRPRVSDFGLAASGVHPDPALDGAAPASSLTVHGQVVGTPSHMAPEQWTGAEVDARTDQFAFCVALWTALYQVPPFPGDTVAELRAAVVAGRRVEPGAEARDLPRWLAPVLGRGLAVDPAARWPSMTALLAELDRRMSARRRAWLVAGAGLLVIGSAGGALAVTGAARSNPVLCAAPTARLDEVWGGARRAALEAHLAAIDPATGPARFAAAAAVFDRAAPAWAAMHVEACRANRIDGRQSDTVLDARMKCLDGWLAGLGGAVRGLEEAADAAALEGAIKGVALAPLERCADADALLAADQLPAAPAARAEAKAIRAEVVAINTDRKAGKLDGLAARGDALVARARALGHPPTLAKALAIRWRIAVTGGDMAGGLGFMRELTEVAARGHDDEEAANTWALMGRLTSQFQGQPDEARIMMIAARAASARAGDPPRLRAEVLANEADVLVGDSDPDGARLSLVEARTLLEGVGAGQPGSPDAPSLAGLLQTLGEIEWTAGRLDAAVATLRQALATFDRAYGPDTVDAGGVQLSLAQVLLDAARLDEAEAAATAAVRVREHRTGESPTLAVALSVRAQITAARGRTDEALAEARRALAIGRATMPADDAQLMIIAADLAAVLSATGRAEEALATYDEVLAAATRAEMATANVASWWINRADLERSLGRCADALVHYRKGGDLGVALQGEQSPYAASARRGEGACLHALGRDREAIEQLERALALPARPSHAVDVALAKGLLGMLLADTGRDRARGVALAREAATALRAARTTDPRAAVLDAWLARASR